MGKEIEESYQPAATSFQFVIIFFNPIAPQNKNLSKTTGNPPIPSILPIAMEIASTTLSVSRPPPLSLPISSSTSAFFNTAGVSLYSTPKRCSSLFMGRVRTHRPKKGMGCYALFGLGVPELVVIAGVAALVFGPKKLPEVGKSIGKTVKSFQQAAKEFETELKREPEETTTETPAAISEEKKPQQQDLEV
ncbi:unnamed protein product [Linum tenue]|uniref:Uncharacterized protein n=2 Tax=Linum TaxID=4005 RepID=A0AAV0HGW4_9ROSI|nr:unnamed protein product [Linum tenue]